MDHYGPITAGMKAHQKSVGLNDEWLTPPEIIAALGPFDLDPAAPIIRPWDTARAYYTVEDDGLTHAWFGRVWLNPPFNRYQRPKFMQKMAQHRDGIMLVPAACETEAFGRYVWGVAAGVLMLDHRPHFYTVDGRRADANSGCTICLVAYGADNLAALRNSGLGVVLTQS